MRSGDVDLAGDRRHPFLVHPLLPWEFSIGSVVFFEVPPVLEVPMRWGDRSAHVKSRPSAVTKLSPWNLLPFFDRSSPQRNKANGCKI